MRHQRRLQKRVCYYGSRVLKAGATPTLVGRIQPRSFFEIFVALDEEKARPASAFAPLYYVKYMRKSVSIIHDGTVENWAADENGKVRKVETLTNPFSNYSKPVLGDRVACAKWMCDFAHFSGDSKPWLSERGLPIYLSETTGSRFRRPHHLWWWTLRELTVLTVNTELWIPKSIPLRIPSF
jgi:hypothetical protein